MEQKNVDGNFVLLGVEDYLRGGTMYEGRTYGVPKSGLCREETIYEGGLYMKIVRMEYQRVDCAGGRLSTRGDYT